MAEVELAFVLAPGQNLFFSELVEALAEEVNASGNARASIHVGGFPDSAPGRIYVLAPPHEYWTLLHGRHGPLPEVLDRTIYICGEQPNTSFFDANLHYAPMAGAVFDINRFGIRAFAMEGIVAHHLQLGWTQAWDHLDPQRERDIDVLYMGSHTDRRARVVGAMARSLSRFNNVLLFSDNSRPNWRSSANYLTNAQKWDLLSRAKVLLNVHQEQNPYFEWLRIVQAMSSGAVVVSEHSVDYAPLVPGEHLLLGDPDSLDLLCARLLDDEAARTQIQAKAYRMVKEDLPLAGGVAQLVTAACELDASVAPIRETRHRFFTQPEPTLEDVNVISLPFSPGSFTSGDHNAAWIRRALKDLRLDLMQIRRDQARIELETLSGHRLPGLAQIRQTLAYGSATPRISVITALYNHAQHISGALASVASSIGVELELIVVDDGSSDGSGTAVTRWMAANEDVPALLLRHPVNRGLAETRNHALGLARGELIFVLDADNEVYPRCLRRLQDTLDHDSDAAFAYCSLEMFTGTDCLGLLNVFGWQPERLRAGNYIDAMSLLRTAVIREDIGGYPTDARLHGWEDYALYCRIASAGMHGARVPEILGRYRVARHSMLGLTNISSTDAFSVIIEDNPELMAGLQAPD